MFAVEWLGHRVALRANNGKYVCTKKNGQLAAVSDSIGEYRLYTEQSTVARTFNSLTDRWSSQAPRASLPLSSPVSLLSRRALNLDSLVVSQVRMSS